MLTNSFGQNMKLSTVDTKGYDPGEARTSDLHPVKVALSLLSYGIFKNAYVTASLIFMLKQLYIIN
ncbi:hypothetical protein CON72_15090 [Bacillus wiedmannii]|nr:hypothetical protein CON72_15090 [Bacillus wiedmannii]